MTVTGIGGTSSGNSNTGIDLYRGQITNTGSGTLTVTGTGNGTGNSGGDRGLSLNGDDGAVISTVNGALSVTGQGGGAGSGTNNYGVYVGNSGTGSTITTTGSGNIVVNGIRGGGDTATNFGVDVATANGIQTTSTGNITVSTDTIALAQANDINSVGNLTIYPHTNTNTIGVGTGTGVLALTDTYLGYLTWGTGKTLTIGDATNTSAIDINSAFTFPKAVQFTTNGGNITLDTGVTDSLASGTAITFNNPVVVNATDTVSTSNGNILFSSTVDGGALR